jgi:adenylate kinase
MPPNLVGRWRSRDQKNDEGEKRGDNEKSIEEHQFMNRAMSMVYSGLTGASVKIGVF